MCNLIQPLGSHEIFYWPKTSVGNPKSNIEEVTSHIEPWALQVECSLVLWRRLGHLLCHYHPWLLYDDNVSLGFSTADPHASNNRSSENQNDGESSGDHNGNDAAFDDLDVAAL